MSTIPLFPLGSPLFPGMVLPLHIFEQRYRRLVQDLLDGAEDESAAVFGVVSISAGHEVGEESATSLADTGCLADVRAVAALPDGRYELVVVGVRRFRLRQIISDQTPYLQAEVTWLDESEGADANLLADRARASFASYRDALGNEEVSELPGDPTLLSYALGAAVALPPADRQQLLACRDTAARLRLLLRLMGREESLLRQLHVVPADDLLRTGMSPN